MRALPSVSSASFVQLAAQLALALTDGSSYTFTENDMAAPPKLTAEVPFGGGIAKPTTLDVTLSTSLGWLQQHLATLQGSRARLTIFANSDQFQPHAGVVRGVTYDWHDLNKVTLQVVDPLLDQDPLVPVEALTDSWSTPHLEDLQSGYPLYYGKHVRPFYLAAVTSDCSVFLGPRNVSSANHVSSALGMFGGSNQSSLTTAAVLDGGVWAQEAAGNTFSAGFGGSAFAVSWFNDGSPAFGFYSQGVTPQQYTAVMSAGLIVTPSIGTAWFVTPTLQYNPNPAPWVRPLHAEGSLAWSDPYTATSGNYGFSFYVSSGPGRIYDKPDGLGGVARPVAIVDVSSYLAPFSFAMTSSLQQLLLNGGFGLAVEISPYGTGQFAAINATLNLSRAAGQLDATRFKRYSVFALPVSSADVAVSANPWGILDDVLTRYTGTPYNQAQSSAAQVTLASCGWQVNALFHERQPLSQIINELGLLTGTYTWVGDSGALSCRVYAESGLATVDWTVPAGDLAGGSLTRNPLGTSGFLQQAASAVELDWGYDFRTRAYASTSVVNRLTNAKCTAAWSAGVQKSVTRQSRYVVDASVASAALYQLVRFSTQAADYLTAQLPARYLGLELADVLRVQHPLLPSCSGLFQVTRLTVDYFSGTVGVVAAALLAGN